MKTIDELIPELQKEAGDYDSFYSIEDYDCLEGVEYETVQEGKILSESRWSNRKENVIKIGEKFLGISWDDPATEQQEGQDTSIRFYEVKPEEKVTIEYIPVSKEV